MVEEDHQEEVEEAEEDEVEDLQEEAEVVEEVEVEAMRYAMLPRKKRELYKAMQIGLAKKEQRASELEARKNKLKAEGKYGHEKSEKSEEEKPKRAAAGSKKARAKR